MFKEVKVEDIELYAKILRNKERFKVIIDLIVK